MGKVSGGHKSRLRRGDRSNTSKEFLGFDDELRSSQNSIVRFDPESVEHLSLSLQQIMDLEENGEIQVAAENPGDSLLITMVRRALVRLPKIERLVIGYYYVRGMTVGEIADDLNLLTPVTANNVRMRAIQRFEVLFVEEKRLSGVTADYNCCPVCDNDNLDALEEYIHFWLDAKKHKLFGLPTEINRKFDIQVTQKQIAEHVEYHMTGIGDLVELTPEKEDKDSKTKMTPPIGLSISVELKNRIEGLAFPYSVSFSELCRIALKTGIDVLEVRIPENERLKKIQLQAVRLMGMLRKG